MSLSPHRIQKIYLAATMNYGLGSDDPEELAYYKKIRTEMDKIKKNRLKKGCHLIGIPQKKLINESEYFFIN